MDEDKVDHEDPTVFQSDIVAIPRMTWSRLRRAFNLPIYSVSILVLVAVPTISAFMNFLSNVAGPEPIQHFLSDIRLPKTMFFAYVVAVLLILTRFVYDFFCPKIIHDFATYDEFCSMQACPAVELYRYISTDKFRRQITGQVRDFLWWRAGRPAELMDVDWEELREELKDLINGSGSPNTEGDHKLSLAFELVVRVVQSTNPLALAATYLVLILAGLLVILIIGIQFKAVMTAAF